MVRKVQERKALAAALEEWISELNLRLERFEMGIEGGRRVLFSLMQAAGLRQIQLAEATLSIGAGKAKVIITDEAKVPDDMCRITREPNRTKIGQAIKDGETVPGAVLSNGDDRLTIKTR